ncbi:hypothetical protein NFJ02_35g88360 [Pycnococcus provasolii]
MASPSPMMQRTFTKDDRKAQLDELALEDKKKKEEAKERAEKEEKEKQLADEKEKANGTASANAYVPASSLAETNAADDRDARERDRLRALEETKMKRKAEHIGKCIRRFMSHNPQKGRNKKEKQLFREALSILFEDISRKVYTLKLASIGDCYFACMSMPEQERRKFNATLRLIGKKTVSFKTLDEKQMAVYYALLMGSEASTYKLPNYPNVHNVKAESLRQRGFGASRMFHEFGFSATGLNQGGYEEVDLIDGELPPRHLRIAGIPLSQVLQTTHGYQNALSLSTAKTMRGADFSIEELRSSGTFAWDLHLGAGDSESALRDGGYERNSVTSDRLRHENVWSAHARRYPTRPVLDAASVEYRAGGDTLARNPELISNGNASASRAEKIYSGRQYAEFAGQRIYEQKVGRVSNALAF